MFLIKARTLTYLPDYSVRYFSAKWQACPGPSICDGVRSWLREIFFFNDSTFLQTIFYIVLPYIKDILVALFMLGLTLLTLLSTLVVLRTQRSTWSRWSNLTRASASSSPLAETTDYILNWLSTSPSAFSTTFTSSFRTTWCSQIPEPFGVLQYPKFCLFLAHFSTLVSVGLHISICFSAFICMYAHMYVVYVFSHSFHFVGLCLYRSIHDHFSRVLIGQRGFFKQ